MPRIPFPRTLAGIGAGLILAVGLPFAASAHVTINPDQAKAGSWTYVTFRVPNESASAKTVGLDIHLPVDTPLTHVSYQPAPGWTGSVTTGTLPTPVTVSGNTITQAPTDLVLTAAPGGGIPTGQLQTFLVSLGPVPDVGSVVIPVTQTYDDGTVVEWKATPAQVAADKTLEPAPVLYVDDPSPAAASGASVTVASASTDGASATVALALSIAALVVAAASAILAAFGLRRQRKNVA